MPSSSRASSGRKAAAKSAAVRMLRMDSTSALTGNSACNLSHSKIKTLHFHLSLNHGGRLGTKQMTSQPDFSIFPCSSLPSGTWQTPGLSDPWCCLPTSSSVCFVFFPLSLCLARWFWPDPMSRRPVHTTSVVSLYGDQEVFVWSDCLLDLGTDFLIGNMVFVWDA